MTRKIEKSMTAAIRRIVDGCGRGEWRLDNTAVKPADDGAALVYLHGHNIARVTRYGAQFGAAHYCVALDSCGWKTATTKSRFNTILREFRPGNAIYQKRGEWRNATPGGNDWPFFDGVNI